jgi:membrane-associated phospholipid phosphatase
MVPIYTFGIQLIQALQTLSPVLDVPMKFFSFLGTVEFYLLLVPFIYWLVDAQLGIRIFFVLIGTDFLGSAFKQLLHQPRPYWIGDVKQLAAETSYGIPSTHASDSFAVWGSLAARLRQRWMWIAACLVVFLIGLSRLYLGVHFPTDVLGGWLIGLIAISLFAAGEPLLLPWLKKQSHASLIAIGFVVSILMILIGELNLSFSAFTPDPAGWAQFSSQARLPDQYITLAGAFFGAVAGYVFMLERASFRVKSGEWQKVACYFLGIAGVLLIYLGLDVLFSLIAADESALGYVLRYLRYGAVTFWVMFGAPWAFLKVGLADPLKQQIEPAWAMKQRPT